MSLDELWDWARVVVILLPERALTHATLHGEMQKPDTFLGLLRKLSPYAPEKKPKEKYKEPRDSQIGHLFLVFTA